jgi:hypothetical protein
MVTVAAGLGATAGRGARTVSPAAAVPALGTLSLAFGLWYAAAAWSLAPYPF